MNCCKRKLQGHSNRRSLFPGSRVRKIPRRFRSYSHPRPVIFMAAAPLRRRTMDAPMEKKTRIPRGHLAAWGVTSAVLREIGREPLARLSDVVEAARRRRLRLVRMAGAFDYAGTLQGVAEKIFTATPCS